MVLQFALFEAAMIAPYQALRTDLAAEYGDMLAAVLSPVPWEPWRRPCTSTRFCVVPGVMAGMTAQWHGNCSVGVGAVHHKVLGSLGVARNPLDLLRRLIQRRSRRRARITA